LVRFSDLPNIKVSGADKYGHFTFHLFFTLLWGYYSKLQQKSIEYKGLFKIAFASLCYGIIIEFLQETFTTTRHADVLDVLANLGGALTAILIFLPFKFAQKS
jgi:VanZ family protein